MGCDSRLLLRTREIQHPYRGRNSQSFKRMRVHRAPVCAVIWRAPVCHVSDLGKSVSVTLPGGRIEHRILCRPMSLCRSNSRLHSANNAGAVRRAENAVEGSTTAAATAPRADLSEVGVINDDVVINDES